MMHERRCGTGYKLAMYPATEEVVPGIDIHHFNSQVCEQTNASLELVRKQVMYSRHDEAFELLRWFLGRRNKDKRAYLIENVDAFNPMRKRQRYSKAVTGHQRPKRHRTH